MQNAKRLISPLAGSFVAALALGLAAGCKTGGSSSPAAATSSTSAPAPTSATMAAPAAAPKPAVPAFQAVRIKAGPGESFKDAEGNTWLVEQGFKDGDVVERPDIAIANTKTPAIYRSERYSMTSFTHPLPNGKYTVKLHFAETFEGIGAAGDRVFSFTVEGKEFKDFDVWVKAGGPLRAYIETVDVEITDGKLDVTFTPKVENPEINGIEILPRS